CGARCERSTTCAGGWARDGSALSAGSAGEDRVDVTGETAAAQLRQFEHHGRADDLGTEVGHERLGRGESAAGGEDVVDQQDALAPVQDIRSFDRGSAVFE